MDVNFSSNDEGSSVYISTGEGEVWTEQADLFFNFLLVQGFIVTERMISRYFKAKAKEMKDLRSNKRDDTHDPF
jgi:hypothetical protein